MYVYPADQLGVPRRAGSKAPTETKSAHTESILEGRDGDTGSEAVMSAREDSMALLLLDAISRMEATLMVRPLSIILLTLIDIILLNCGSGRSAEWILF